MGRGKSSFPSQTMSLYNGKFSYCLVNRNSSKPPSTIIFGDAAIPKNAVFTPLLSNPKQELYYHLSLMGISVGGSRVRGITESLFKIDPVTGDGGFIIDTATSVTSLEHSAYIAFRDAFRQATKNLKRVPVVGPIKILYDTSYNITDLSKVKVPEVVFHFGGGDVLIPTNNVLFPADEKNIYRFAFTPSFDNLSIFGNIQQAGFRIAYDLVGSRVGFLPNAC